MKFKYFVITREPYYKIWYMRIGGGRFQLIVSFHDIRLDFWKWWFTADWRFEHGRLSNIRY